MNMKKALAALSAASVALSAMATTVMADDTAMATTAFGTQSIKYSLVEEVAHETEGSVTFRTTAGGTNGVNVNPAHVLYLAVPGDYQFAELGDGGVRLTVELRGTSPLGRTVTETVRLSTKQDDWASDNSFNVSTLLANSVFKDQSGNIIGIELPILSLGGRVTAFITNNSDVQLNLTLTLAHNVARNDLTRDFDADNGPMTFLVDAATALISSEITASSRVGTPTQVDDAIAAVLAARSSAVSGASSMTGVTNASREIWKYPMATSTGGRVTFVPVAHNQGSKNNDYYDWWNTAAQGNNIGNNDWVLYTTEATDLNSFRPVDSYTGTPSMYAFQTPNAADVITYLSTRAVNGIVLDARNAPDTGKGYNEARGVPYYNVQGVINDAVSNYNSVSVIFHTAKEDIRNIGGTGDGIGRYGSGGDYTGFYRSLQPQLYNRYTVDNYDNWGNSSQNIGFPGYSFGSLFNGALVINENMTMSLSDVNAFDYAETTLTFNLDQIFANPNSGASYNPALGMVWSMRLATSALWFWDEMEIQVANVATETVENLASEEEEDDIITEEVVVDDFEEEEWETEAPETEEVTVETEVIDVPSVNPSTGNAPIALAVIPVALAAAAIVIKKRK